MMCFLNQKRVDAVSFGGLG